MTNTRQDVWNLGKDWSDTLLWYARAVKLLRTRDISDVTSWTFLAGIHGFDQATWASFGYVDPSKPLPNKALQDTYWIQCQHQSWYFLPWHRGYVWSFETIVRAGVVSLGGPADWALPYWNYNNGNIARSNELPPAFAAQDWPGDNGENPLFVKYRYGLDVQPIVVPPNQIRPIAQNDDNFTGASGGAHAGFGGPQTIFHHGGEDNSPNGGVESEPHNNVHGVVGGQIPDSDPNDPTNYGLMSIPDQAALDPIFWLHHANIDRLWKVWLNADAAHTNPKDPTWLGGPASRTFAVPNASGDKVTFTPAVMLDTKTLGYIYEDETQPKPPPRRQSRLQTLGVAKANMVAAIASPPMNRPVELVGASDRSVNLSAGELSADVRLDPPTRSKVTQSFAAAASPTGATEPDRIFLAIENIRGVQDSALVEVYVSAPQHGNRPPSAARLAGTISGFGLTKATRTGPGNGLSQTFDISEIIDELHLQGGLDDLQHLDVKFIPLKPLHPAGGVSVGAVKVFRQPQ